MLKTFRSYQLAVQFYKTARDLKAPYGLRDQLGRAASSIGLNLAEGSGKSGRRDRLKYYEIALGSIRECEAILDLIDVPQSPTRQLLDDLARNVFCLCRSLRRA